MRASASRWPPSFEAEPSTPRPTGTPASRIARTGAMPEASRMFEQGQCATPVPVRANRPMPGASSLTQCACHTSRPTQPGPRRTRPASCRTSGASSRCPCRSRPGECEARHRSCVPAPPTRASACGSPRTASTAQRRCAASRSAPGRASARSAAASPSGSPARPPPRGRVAGRPGSGPRSSSRAPRGSACRSPWPPRCCRRASPRWDRDRDGRCWSCSPPAAARPSRSASTPAPSRA
ncbi:hypothetical protein Y694_03938 [Methylibium sp. T29-B]|nr:hypothetical protein Y694_03938 [Methylibium sp. T29-B]